MGYGPETLDELRMYTNKGVKVLPSNCVWVISASNKPQRYHLTSVFKVDDISEGAYDHPDFKNTARGTSGRVFGATLEIGSEPWFRYSRIR